MINLADYRTLFRQGYGFRGPITREDIDELESGEFLQVVSDEPGGIEGICGKCKNLVYIDHPKDGYISGEAKCPECGKGWRVEYEVCIEEVRDDSTKAERCDVE